MAAQYKKKISAERMIYPSGVYPDLYDNNKTTTDLQIGTVSGVTANSLMLGDFTMPVKNAFGDGELVGAKLGLYINSISRDNSVGGVPGIKVFKVPVNIGNNEGGKASAGSLISLSDFAQICSYHEEGGIVENFSGGDGQSTEEKTEVIQDVIIRKHGPYMSKANGYEYGYRFGNSAGFEYDKMSKSKHFKRFGDTLPDGTEVYKVEFHINQIDKNRKRWKSKRESKGFWRFNHEMWNPMSVGGDTIIAGHSKLGKNNIIQYETSETIQRTNTDEIVQRANTSNTFFDDVQEAPTFKVSNENQGGIISKVAYGDVALSTTKVRTGGQSLHMHSVYPHRDGQITDITYVKGTNDNTENQQTTFVTKQLPLPLHQYSARSAWLNSSSSSGGGQGKTKPLVSTVSICLNIDSLAPVLRRIGLGKHTDTNYNEALTESEQQHRLNRSLCVTFGEEKPIAGERLYDYVKRHAPDSHTHTLVVRENKAWSWTGTTVTITDNSHPYLVTQKVYIDFKTIAGGLSDSDMPSDGQYTITGKTANSFSFTVGTSPDATRTGTADVSTGHRYQFLGSNNNKSFMGLAIVNVGGKYGLAKLSRAKIDGTTPLVSSEYSKVDFGLDRARGEVVVTPNTSTVLLAEGIEGKFINLDFQFHPDGSHAHFGIYDPESGDLHTKINGNPRIYNIKNTTASGAGLWAHNDSTNFPRYMTIWNSNYQAINGTYDTTEKKYKTGLRVAQDVDSNTVPVYMSREMDTTSIYQGGMSDTLSAYLNLAAGDVVAIKGSGSSNTALDDLVITRKHPLTLNGFPVIQFKTAQDVNVNDTIYFMHTTNQDFYVDTPATMENSIFIDNITLNNFNMGHNNATPSISNPTPSRLKIPATYKGPSPGYYYHYASDSSTVTNIRDRLADFPSYLCFGFDNISDFEGGAKYMLLNGFKAGGANEQIFLGDVENIVDPEDSNAVLSSGNIDSEKSCLRVGYTSFEDYGRQGANDSYSKLIDGAGNPEDAISKIPNESPTFDNNSGSPNTQIRGLSVGDLGVDDAEFSIHSNDTYNVDGFTQKGFIQWNFDRRQSNLGASGTVEINNGSVNTSQTQIDVKNITSGTTTLQVNNYIKVNSEIMLITEIEDIGATGGIHRLQVVRAQAGTSAGTHAQDDDVYLVALPEKRESIFTSARILNIVDSNTLEVDSPELFKFDETQEYLLYIYDDSHASPTSGYPLTLLATKKSNSQITFDKRHNINKGQEYKFLISPKKYWLMAEIHNHTDGPLDRRDSTTVSNTETVFQEKTAVTNPNESDRVVILDEALNTTETKINLLVGDPIAINRHDVIQIGEEKMLVVKVDSGDPSFIGVKRGVFGTTAATHQKKSILYFTARRYLPEKSYDSAVMLTGLPNGSHSSFGATFNETLYNDGNYINSWDLDPFIKEDDTAVDLKDYGFGDFDEEKRTGGHLGHLNLNVQNDISKYKELDISGVVKVDKVSDNDTFTVMITPDEPTDNYKINVDTEDGTNPVYITAIYEDELPKITDFKIKPNEKDPFFVDYNWKCNDEDIWYGFLHVSGENIKDQYHGALMHIPLNDDANDQQVVSAFAVKNAEGDLLTTDKFTDSVSSTASYVPKHTIEGLAGNAVKFDSNDVLNIGSNSNDCFEDLGKEMSIVLHCINTSPNFNSGADQYLIRKGQTLSNTSLDIFARRVGITSTGQIVVRVHSDGATSQTKYVELTSSTIIQKDVPLNIIVTFDANLYRGNVKLFINGRLEDQSGEVLSAHAVGNNTGWIHKTDIFSGNATLIIGAKTESMISGGWNGTIEELVIYDRLIYPVDVKSGEFTFTKPLEELTAETNSSSKNYNARLFVKDYHNIRGSSKEDVAMTASISYKKAAFNLSGVAE